VRDYSSIYRAVKPEVAASLAGENQQREIGSTAEETRQHSCEVSNVIGEFQPIVPTGDTGPGRAFLVQPADGLVLLRRIHSPGSVWHGAEDAVLRPVQLARVVFWFYWSATRFPPTTDT